MSGDLGILMESQHMNLKTLWNQHIESNIKLYYKPLEQVSRRLIEYDNLNVASTDIHHAFKLSVKYRFELPNSTRICSKGINIMPDVMISNRKCTDKWFLTKDNQIVEMHYVYVLNKEYFICGTIITDKADFFSYPFNSRYIDMYESNMIKSPNCSDFKISSFKSKSICLSTTTSYVFVLMIHSLTMKQNMHKFRINFTQIS